MTSRQQPVANVANRARRRPYARALGLAIAPLLALAACSTGDPDKGDSGSERLADYLGYQAGGFGMQDGMLTGPGFALSFGSEPEMSPEERRKFKKVEDAVAECMNEQGFEYVPYIPSGAEEDSELKKASELEPAEFVKQYGYGITMGLDLGDPDDGESDNPNNKIRSALSASAQKAYDEALFGEAREGGGGHHVEKSDGGKSVVQGGEIGGCRGEAEKEIFGDRAGGKDEMVHRVGPSGGGDEFDGLFRDLEALRKRIDRDSTMAEANREWSNCMADAGHADLETPEDAAVLVTDRLDELFMAAEGEDGEPSEPDNAAIAEVQAYELKVAGADFDCQSDDYTKTAAEVRQKHEAAFIADHRTELEQYRDWLSEAGPGGGAPHVVVGG